MSKETMINKMRTALLIIDMQNDLVVDTAGPYSAIAAMVKEGKIIQNIKKLLNTARSARVPVFHIKTVHHRDSNDIWSGLITDAMGDTSPAVAQEMKRRLVEGSPGADFAAELKPQPEEYIIVKRRSSAFFGTDLELLLRRCGVDTLILTGVVTSMCVETTARSAKDHDFNVIIASDCCADMVRETHEFLIKNTFRRLGRVRTAIEVIASIA